MSMLNDPEMVEIIHEFCQESSDILDQLEEMLESYEDNPSSKTLEKFGQTIDRIMGAAKNVDAMTMGHYSELGKTISYKASQSMDHELLKIVSAVLFDTVDILKILNKNIKEKQKEEVDGINLVAFGSRLKWLSEKFKQIQRSSVAIDEDSTSTNQKSIDDLLKSLGL